MVLDHWFFPGVPAILRSTYLIFSLLFFSVTCFADLTGYWDSDGGSRYRFRQVGDKLFWTVDHSPTVINVFYGTIAGNVISGTWADLPDSQSLGQGTISLRIESINRVIKIDQTGNYGDTIWTRSGSTSTGTKTGGQSNTGGGRAGAGDCKPPMKLIEELEVNSGKYQQTAKSGNVLKKGCYYRVVVSGTFNPRSFDPNETDGHDAVYCYPPACSPPRKSNQLKMNGRPLGVFAYQEDHMYRLNYEGEDKSLGFYIQDSRGASYQDNQGKLKIQILGLGNERPVFIDSTASKLPAGVLEIVQIPSNKPERITTQKSLNKGQWYIFEASGQFSVWEWNNPVGVDAVYCHRCKPVERWDQLKINDRSMANIQGGLIPYNPEHVYRVRYKGEGKPVVFHIHDALGSFQDNSGHITVKIRTTN